MNEASQFANSTVISSAKNRLQFKCLLESTQLSVGSAQKVELDLKTVEEDFSSAVLVQALFMGKIFPIKGVLLVVG